MPLTRDEVLDTILLAWGYSPEMVHHSRNNDDYSRAENTLAVLIAAHVVPVNLDGTFDPVGPRWVVCSKCGAIALATSHFCETCDHQFRKHVDTFVRPVLTGEARDGRPTEQS